MSKGAEMTDLITRLEAATEGSQELGDDVLLACGWTEFIEKGTDNGFGLTDDKHWMLPPKSNSMYLRYHSHCPNPTTSIDAALTLVPEGWSTKIEGGGVRKWNVAVYSGRKGDWAGTLYKYHPALAICIAAIKARSTTCPQRPSLQALQDGKCSRVNG